MPGRRIRLIMSEVLKFPDGVRRRSNDGASEAAASRKKDRTVTNVLRLRVPVMTGDQWREFIRLLTPDEQQAFMADVWKLINRYRRHIGAEAVTVGARVFGPARKSASTKAQPRK